ncbi:hypothetical protein JZ751_016299 [Albula glossodonta]|uniref:HIVEP zinc finger 3 n=1 Tax=Albula glossodonta TaxID=121402 RepID=A0A8T2MIV3_9TELE|nr:hypothetical protein JZ751_016299 [Albula glossodonta]
MRRPSLPPAMEAQRSQSASREGSGRQDPPPSPSEASGHASQTPPPARPPHGRPPHHRQPKRGGFEGQLLRVPQPPSSSSSSSSSSAALGLGAGWQLMEAPGPSGGSFPPPSSSPSSSSTTRGPHPIQELQEGAAPPTRRERKPQKPGKYVCTYCGRPCAKPSVLQKHIRSHTGERPYPCSPCGFSFKTKSNLYKHRKSHAHRIKAGLASGLGGGEGGGTGAGTGLGEEPEEPTEGESTDSEDETGQHQHQHASSHPTSSSSSTAQEKQKSAELPLGLAEELPRPTEDSHAVKQRLAMRLSERKRFPAISPDETPSPSSSLGPGSKGSTESGYFSRSGSAELSQVSPPNANAKSYAEIILGKYGRLGGQPRHPHQQHLHVSSSPSSSSSGLGSEEKSIPFSVPKTQVIEHITKLITINEAVVDTSEIDSVKPRRSSLSRRSSIESPKFSTLKEPYVFDPKGEPSGSGAPLSLGSFSTGESFRSRFTKGDPSAPLLRSQSMPSSAGQVDTAGTSTPNRNFRLTQSFDEQQAAAAEMRVGHHQRMLKRQPAIEVPLGAEFIPEEAGPSSSSCSSSSPFAPAVATPSSDLVRGKAVTQQQHRRGPRLYECEACGARCKKRESYETHRRCFCTANPPQEQQPPPTTATATVTAGAAERPGEAGGTHREDRPQMMHYKFRAVAVAVRKRRKEESLEEDPPSPGPLAVTFPPTPTVPMPEAQPQPDSQRDRKSTWKEISVIQHTSSFEKQESVAMESQEREERPSAALQSSHQDEPQPEKPPQTPTKQHPFSRLVRQHNIQVPEILVTEEPDADMVLASPLATASSSSTKEPEKVEEFQWPQRSQTLAQLPAEKLPPKKKRLRLAEAAQSSGESSFESTSLPRSPSQESSISHASSRSASFEEPGKADTEMQLAAGATGAAHMLTVPSGPHQHHPHREMRRSASEQAPASAQHPAQIAEARSKSFDYGCLSPQRSAAAWKERRKCLLVKHATLGEPEQDEPAPFNPGPTPISSDPSSSSSRLSPEPSGKSLQLFQSPGTPGPSGSPLLSGYPPPSVTREGYPQIGQLFPAAPVAVTVADVLAASQIIPRAFLHTATAPPPIHPAQLRLAERLGLPLQPFPPLLPLGYPTGAAQALYLPVPSGLALQVPQDPPPQDSKSLPSASHSPPIPLHPHPHPIIAPCLEQLAPVVSLVVPVRLQTHVPTYASAMYTTLSQILVTSSHHVPEPVCCSASWVIMGKRVGGVEGGEKAQPQSPYLTVPTPDFKTRMPAGCLALGAELGAGLGEGGAGYGSPGVGGSKRMLSPAGSLELSTEAQRQQKRVKEEEEDKEEEEEEEDNGSDRGGEVSSVGGRTKGKGEGTVVEETITMVQEAETKVQELKEEVPKEEDRKEAGPEKPELLKHEEEEEGEEGRRTRAQSPQGRKSPSPAYPTLHTTTSVSWCYLNYTKPNPSPQQDPHASVYSSWCVSVHNPNLPGLSTRAALSLLRSKQKHSRETYTMANAPHPTSGKLAPGTTRKPRMSEVRSTSPSTPIKVKETPPSEKEKEEEKKGKKDEAAPSTSKRSEQPSRIRIFEGGPAHRDRFVGDPRQEMALCDLGAESGQTDRLSSKR